MRRDSKINYSWKTDKNGKSTETPVHEFSHIPDAIRYGVVAAS